MPAESIPFVSLAVVAFAVLAIALAWGQSQASGKWKSDH